MTGNGNKDFINDGQISRNEIDINNISTLNRLRLNEEVIRGLDKQLISEIQNPRNKINLNNFNDLQTSVEGNSHLWVLIQLYMKNNGLLGGEQISMDFNGRKDGIKLRLFIDKFKLNSGSEKIGTFGPREIQEANRDLPGLSQRDLEVPRLDLNQIRNYQIILTDLGFDTKGTDGKIGRNTKNAIREFQLKNGLQVTGEFNNQTINELNEQPKQEIGTTRVDHNLNQSPRIERRENPESTRELFDIIIKGEPDNNTFQRLIAEGANINAPANEQGETVFMYAAGLCTESFFRKLLDIGGNIELKNIFDRTPLIYAAYYGNVKNFKILLERGADPYKKDKEGKSAYDYSRSVGNNQILDLIENNDNKTSRLDSDQIREYQIKLTDLGFNTRGSNGRISINTKNAIRQFQSMYGLQVTGEFTNQTINKLNELNKSSKVEKGENPESTKKLFDTIIKGDTDNNTFQRLIAEGANINAVNKDGFTPLILAAKYGRDQLVKLLVENGADTTYRHTSGNTAYEFYIMYRQSSNNSNYILNILGSKQEFEQILKLPPSEQLYKYIMFCNNNKDNEFYSVQFDIKKFDELVRAGARLDYSTELGNTLLMLGVSSNSKELVKKILDSGVDINAINRYGETALINRASSLNKNIDILKLLLERGADLDIENNGGDTAIDLLKITLGRNKYEQNEAYQLLKKAMDN